MVRHSSREPRSLWRRAPGIVAVLALVVAGLVAPAGAQDLRATLFRDIDAAMQAARETHADVLAPKNFELAEKYYNRAESSLKRGRSIEDIRRDLDRSRQYLDKAMEVTKLAEVTFATTMQARDDAIKVKTSQFAPAEWNKAEAKFREATWALEEGDVNKAKRKGKDALDLYREAELVAIKTHDLDETRQLLQRAARERADKYAPKTYAQAQELLQKAEEALEKNRYDRDLPRSLARDAKYQAKHALYLTDLARRVEHGDLRVEDLVLQAEQPLEQVAGALDVVAQFDQGFADATQAILERIDAQESKRNDLEQELAARERRLSDLETQLADMEKRLGGVSEERRAMQRRIQEEERIREKFESVEKTFDRSEARVLREGNDIILRLVGLNFGVGKDVIEPQYFSLLTKVQNAIRVFPDSRIRIEGHTDSHGTEEANLELSRRRAEAVRQYIIANMGIAPDRIEAVGYGESRPIANNETKEGRAKNRRIDVVISPVLEAARR